MTTTDTTAAPPKEKSADKIEKKVKIKLKRDCRIDGVTHKPGTVVEVSPEVAKEFCDTKFTGKHNFYGHAPMEIPGEDPRTAGPGPYDRMPIVRAVRV